MGRRTWKRRTITDAQIRAALEASGGVISKAAEQLGIDRSTLYRWRQADPSLAPTSKAEPAEVAEPQPGMTADGWKAWVLQTYELDGNELQLLELAHQALEISRDPLFKPADRLSAAGRFQQLLKQLALEDPDDGQTEAQEHASPPQLRRVK